MKDNLNWEKIQNIFFVGIKGVGVAPLAVIAKEFGFNIAGSDISEEFITDEMLNEKGIKVFEDFDEEIVADFFEGKNYDSCLVITTGAHSGYKNPQVLKAQKMGVPYINQGQAVGIFMGGAPFKRVQEGITVTGSHGKTTVSAMIAECLVFLGQDPSYTIGTSKIFPIGFSGHFGRGKYFIAEGDEYVGEPVFDKTPKVLYQKPKYAIINNIDFDHPDIYKNIEEIKEVMLRFINGMDNNSFVFINTDDANLRSLKGKIKGGVRVITYGQENADFTFKNDLESVGAVSFDVYKKNENFGGFALSIPGLHNVKNSLAAIALLDLLGNRREKIATAIASYKGSKRRMEFVGKTEDGAIIIDDYGHHPLEIKSTIDALGKFYGKKIICVFQSHTFSRTKALLKDFSESFGKVEELLLLPIFRSQRDTEKDIMSLDEFTAPFIANLENVEVFDGIEEAVSYIRKKKYADNYMILTIGAGDVYKVGYALTG